SQRKGRLIGLAIWQGLLVFWPVIPVVFIVTLAAQGGDSNTYWTVFGIVLVLVLVPCAMLFARYGLAFAATAITDSTASESIKRSIELGRGYRGKVFWAYALPLGIGMALSAGGSAFLGAIGAWHGLRSLHPFLFVDLEALWSFAVTVFYAPMT